MFLLVIWLLMRFWNMSVHRKQQQINRECDTLGLHESGCCCLCDDEVNLGFNCNKSGGGGGVNDSRHYFSNYLKGTNNFLRGLFAKIPLSQVFGQKSLSSAAASGGLSISQLLAEFGSLDPEVRSELAFMGISEEFLNGEFQWSQEEYSFDDDRDANLLLMSASYEDMAKHLDAHLAELDIESFRAEDINSLLNLKSNMEYNKTSSRIKLPGVEVDEEDLLFSPSSIGNDYLSMDSLDQHNSSHHHHVMLGGRRGDCLDSVDGNAEEEDLMAESISTNCRANKENYTLAFKDSFSGSTDSQSSKGSCSNGGGGGEADNRKISWNQLGNSNNTNQSLDSSGSFVGRWNLRKTASPTKETFQLAKSPRESVADPQMNLVKMFMKQRTLSTSSTTAATVATTTEGQSVVGLSDEYISTSRCRKKSMNDSGKCSTLSQHVLDEEDDEVDHLRHRDDYQLDSLDVVAHMTLPEDHRKRQEDADQRLQDKRPEIERAERRNSKSIQTSKRLSSDQSTTTTVEQMIVFPPCRLPDLDFVHLEHEIVTSQFMGGSGDPFNQNNNKRPNGFDHIVDWDSLLLLLSREHKEMLKRYPVLNERIRNSFQDSITDVFDEFPETIDVTFDDSNVCDCDSLLSSTASNNSSNRYSSDSGLGPNNTYNFEDLRKLFVYEYNALDEEVVEATATKLPKVIERPKRGKEGGYYRERRATMSSMQAMKIEKRVSFEAGLPKKRSNKSTSSIPRLITNKTAAKEEMKANIIKEKVVVSKIPKLIKSPSRTNFVKSSS